ncbi:unnamed protein product [Nezara viridula]|uniref:Brix domain-containing protein n=1 Tax=Nezara viridula TaxID=85310 RepID=A0A9P0MPV7_NEZVI|nr:unnamed protein product [Nezara viridula]
MARKKKGLCKKRNIQAAAEEPEELVRAPHSFIFHRGLVGKYILRLIRDFRNVMEPFTATNLRPRKSNSIKDFVAVTGVLHVSHMVILTQTVLSPYLRIIRVPRGPTLTFKIHNYTLSTDVLSSLRKQYAFNKIFLNSPLVVLNGFTGDDPHIKLMVATFQGMFPTINITTVNLKSISRCVLFNYNKDTKMIDFRHYVIRSRPLGISKAVKKLGRNKIPDLSRYKDVSEFITKSDLLSDSEVEDDPGSHVSLPQTLGPRSTKGNKAAVRLTEYGPRMTLQLIKVEAGIMEGEVLFHEYVNKTEEEKEMIRQRLEEKRKLKEKRRKEQMANVKKKEEAKEAAKQKSLEGMKKAGINVGGEPVKEEEQDDDAEWYRQEVGEEPDPELFQQSQKKSILKRKRNEGGGDGSLPPKRMRKDVHKKSVRFSGVPKKTVNKKNIKQPQRKPVKKQPAGKRKGKGRKNMGTRVTKGKRH